MERDEDAEFSSAMLLVAIAIYVSVFAGTLAGLVAMKDSAGDAFLSWTKDYGAIIAGFPVLIAVWVAKQQLDANRRQHVATVKRSFQKELDALDGLDAFSQNLNSTTYEKASVATAIMGRAMIFVARPSAKDMERWNQYVSSETYSYAKSAIEKLNNSIDASQYTLSGDVEARRYLDESKYYGNLLSVSIKKDRIKLEQYWS